MVIVLPETEIEMNRHSFTVIYLLLPEAINVILKKAYVLFSYIASWELAVNTTLFGYYSGISEYLLSSFIC